MTKIHQQWLQRAEAETIAHSHVIQLYSCVYPMHRGFRLGGRQTNLTKPEASDIITRLMARVKVDGGIRAEAVNEQRGRDWLAKNARRFGLPNLPWDGIDTFRLVGFHVYIERETPWGNGEIIAQVSPIWRCLWVATGDTFDYAPTAWQSTGKDRAFWWKHKEGANA